MCVILVLALWSQYSPVTWLLFQLSDMSGYAILHEGKAASRAAEEDLVSDFWCAELAVTIIPAEAAESICS